MMHLINGRSVLLSLLLLWALTACDLIQRDDPEPTAEPTLKIGLVIDSGSENDRSFNQYSLEGARAAAEELGLEFTYLASQSTSDYESHIESLVQEDSDLIITVGFRMGDATAKAAQRNPEVRFAIVDNAYTPGSGCSEAVADCYSEEGRLTNVTSLMFAEDQVAYLAGTLAACMSETDTVATVAGLAIPPVVRFVTGFNSGALAFNPEATTLYQYIPDFNDPETGRVVAQDFIQQGADVIFAAAGNTGNGGLLAAHEAEVMAIGVDVDQYFTYTDVAPSLLTSASKNVDIAVNEAVRDFVAGNLESGIRLSTLENGGVGLAPYHDWESRIPQDCKDAVEEARQLVISDPTITEAAESG